MGLPMAMVMPTAGLSKRFLILLGSSMALMSTGEIFFYGCCLFFMFKSLIHLEFSFGCGVS